MTNLIATLTIAITTNWTQIEYLNNQCNIPGCLVIHYDSAKDIGKVTTNYLANIIFEGKTNQFLLKSLTEEWPSQKRTRVVGLYESTSFYEGIK